MRIQHTEKRSSNNIGIVSFAFAADWKKKRSRRKLDDVTWILITSDGKRIRQDINFRVVIEDRVNSDRWIRFRVDSCMSRWRRRIFKQRRSIKSRESEIIEELEITLEKMIVSHSRYLLSDKMTWPNTKTIFSTRVWSSITRTTFC